ncbi:DUF4439 domain-containing protein [Nocardioides limicola]|uniref:DUF4439 domain-containing protein n=1 Tax=Nocardioides limicola TaxID=2803368 RepID=UPI00193BC976|nr:DUF4439 domain-containing protein [Nocardioides sp. DJM-14]
MRTQVWQQVLAAEHAAVWTFGLLAARHESEAEALLLAQAHDVHRSRRDHAELALRAAGETPVPSAPAYELLAEEPLEAALAVEQACATGYAALVAALTGEERRWPANALTDAAARALGFRGSPEHFPGLDELAGR